MRKLTVLAVIFYCAGLFAQAPDTLVVPDKVNGDPLGAINITIEGDTTATGARINPNRIYKLEAGKVYYLNGPLTTTAYHLRLIGEKPTAAKRPAVIMPGVRQDGSVTDHMLRLNGDFTFKNIYFMCMAPNGANHGDENMAAIYPDNVRGIIDGCYFEQNRVILFGFFGKMAKVYAHNNYIRNCHQLGVGWWNGGRFIWIWDAAADTVEIVNNTWVNNACYLYTDRDRGTNYVKIEHNTCLNNCGFVFFLHTLTNASISNNIFYNVQFVGEDGRDGAEYKGGWNDYDGLPASVISLDTLTGKGNFKLAPFAEADRVIKVNNNSNYVDPQIIATQDAVGYLVKTEWMNSRTAGMFADNTTWPGLETTNSLLGEDPGFLVNPTVMDSILDYIKVAKDWAPAKTWAYPPDGKPAYVPDWPIPENLTYTNAKLLTAADGGFPLGDLNWFPDKKKAWENWVTKVNEKDTKITPVDFTLKQNYPNPFNPKTTITFTLKNNEHVSLNVYNVLGQKVQTLLDKNMQIGLHQISWNAVDATGKQMPNGVYYYRLETESQSATKKMILMK
ncbi:T9SS type A sorting domain-containing protein [candidate division KSB1 bacterium]|nr:T9SS type A sorting domain-containing protein [candidate division KSB1 bacterium]